MTFNFLGPLSRFKHGPGYKGSRLHGYVFKSLRFHPTENVTKLFGFHSVYTDAFSFDPAGEFCRVSISCCE